MLGAVTDVFDALAAPSTTSDPRRLSARNDQTLFELCGRLATEHDIKLTDRRSRSISQCSRRSVSCVPADTVATSSTPSTRHLCVQRCPDG